LPIIATPKYDMIVPSTGESITYRPYVVKEEKILLIALESESEVAIERAVTDIIKACVESPIKIPDLTMFDIEFMFTTLRSKSVGEGIEVQLKCDSDECDHQQKIKVNLDNIYVANLDTNKEMNIKINDEISVDLRYISYSDSLTQAQRATETESAINMVAKTIDTIYQGEETFACKDAPFKEVVRFVESLNNDQFAKVIEFMQDSPVLTYDIEYKCTACGTDNVKTLKGLTDFFT
jgi:hypothetical protein